MNYLGWDLSEVWLQIRSKGALLRSQWVGSSQAAVLADVKTTRIRTRSRLWRLILSGSMWIRTTDQYWYIKVGRARFKAVDEALVRQDFNQRSCAIPMTPRKRSCDTQRLYWCLSSSRSTSLISSVELWFQITYNSCNFTLFKCSWRYNSSIYKSIMERKIFWQANIIHDVKNQVTHWGK